MTERRKNWITKEDLEETLGGIVDTKINGNLREIKNTLVIHGEKLDDLGKKMDELKPVRDGLSTVSHIKDFASYWAGVFTPIGVIMAALYAIIKFIR